MVWFQRDGPLGWTGPPADPIYGYTNLLGAPLFNPFGQTIFPSGQGLIPDTPSELLGTIQPNARPIPPWPVGASGVNSFQIRPNILPEPGPEEFWEFTRLGKGKYKDTKRPWINIYEFFTQGITFGPSRITDTTILGGLVYESIRSINCKMTHCLLESPVPGFDADNETSWNPFTGLATKSKPKIYAHPAWAPGLFNEPIITTPYALGIPISNPLGVTRTILPPGPYDLNPLTPIVKEPETSRIASSYNFFGYFTERNFYDREWISRWGPFLFKATVDGVSFKVPLAKEYPWGLGGWIPLNNDVNIETYYQRNLVSAYLRDSFAVNKYMQGANAIHLAKPSRILSLRYYLEFTVKTGGLFIKSIDPNPVDALIFLIKTVYEPPVEYKFYASISVQMNHRPYERRYDRLVKFTSDTAKLPPTGDPYLQVYGQESPP